MTKFNSIWGDLEVGSVTPATSENEDGTSAAQTEKTSEQIAEETDEGEEGKEASKETKATITKKTEDKSEEGKKAGEEKKEEYEFTEDDVSKAYEILDQEGVLELNEDDLEELENTPSGIADAVAITVRNKLQAEINAIPPVVQEFYAHVMEGNTPGTFKPKEAISWETADSSDENIKKSALKQLYLDQGMDEESANEEVEEVADSDKFDKKAELAIDVLIKKEEKLKQQKAEAIAKQEELASKKREKEIKDIESLIDTSKEMAGFKLNDTKRKGFKEYLFKVNPRTGKTQMQQNMADPNRKLNIAFLDFVNYTKADLEKEVASTLTKNRKKKLTAYSDKNVASTNSSKSVKTNAENKGGKIVFPTIFGNQNIEIED